MEVYIEQEEIRLVEKFDFAREIRKNMEAAFANGSNDEPFYICNVGDVVKKHRMWLQRMPRVEPFYAMKCNPSEVVVNMLAKLQVGFDCASKEEISLALSAGVPADRIIYANPCKPISHIRYARENGVEMMTFDSLMELKKVSLHHPNAQMVLRIFVGATKAVCPLGLKFGAELADIVALLQVATDLQIKVIGVSFHVGSGCFDATAYMEAIKLSRDVFDLAGSMGHKMTLLDIGGGFPGNIDTPERVSFFENVCYTINNCLQMYFPDPAVRVIAEPGRFYVSSAYQLACSVTSIRASPVDITEDKINYFLNDGVYGSFNCVVFDHYIGEHYLLNDYEVPKPRVRQFESVFWGPTCDSFDKILDGINIRKLDIGECVVFKNMGAYTMAAGCTFNGFPRPYIKYFCSVEMWKMFGSLKSIGCVPFEDSPSSSVLEESGSFDIPVMIDVMDNLNV